MKKNKFLASMLLASGCLAFSVSNAQNNVVKLTTSKQVGETMTFMVNKCYNGVSIDWGNGDAIVYNVGDGPMRIIEGVVQGETIVVSGDQAWTTFSCAGNSITSIDLSEAKTLRSLYCQNNELTSLELKDMELLTDLDCADNAITEIVVSTPNKPELDMPLMENYNVANNQLKGYDGSKQIFALRAKNLQHVNLSGNQYKTAYFTDNSQLVSLKVSDNELSALSFSSCKDLAVLVCNGNNIKKLTTPADKCASMQQLIADDNALTTLDISGALDLTDISVANNQLTSLTMPAAKGVETVDVSGNALGLAALPHYNDAIRYVAFAPQDRLDISGATGIVMKDGVPTVPVVTWGERNDNMLDIAYTRCHGGSEKGTYATITWYAVDENGNTQELAPGKTSSAVNDYYVSAGKFSFFAPYKKAYAEIASKKYEDVKVQTTPIVIGDDITAVESVIMDATNSAFDIYDLRGRLLKKDAKNFDGLQKGIYIVGGKKVLL